MSSTLTSLEDIIQHGEPLSLAWVVEHGDTFQSAWKRSEDPRLMLWIASHVFRGQAAAASLAIARIMLNYIPYDIRDEFIFAIDYAENGEVSQAQIFAGDAWGSFNPAEGSEADLANGAILNAARDAAKIIGAEQIAALVREHVKITVADLVRAGKSGWWKP